MLRRFLVFLTFSTALALLSTSASAQSQSLLCGPEYGGQECIDNFTTDSWGYGGASGPVPISTCRDAFGCPSCQANMAKTYALCTHIEYASGFCVCGDPRPMPTPYSHPQCGILNGSCRVR